MVKTDDVTEVVVLLDRSGSMDPLRQATIDGINELIAEQRKMPGRVRFSLVLFDDRYEPVYEGEPLENVPKMTRENYIPRGTTALLDAWGRAMIETEARISGQPEAEQPDLVLFVVVTDGLENASQEYTDHQVFNAVSRHRNHDGWRFIYLGANQDAIREGSRYGVSQDAAMTFEPCAAGARTMLATLSNTISGLRLGSTDGGSFSDIDRQFQENLRRKKKRLLH